MVQLWFACFSGWGVAAFFSVSSAVVSVVFSVVSLFLWILGKTYRWLVFQSKLVIKSFSLSVKQSLCFFTSALRFFITRLSASTGSVS